MKSLTGSAAADRYLMRRVTVADVIVPETSFIPLDQSFGREGLVADAAPGITHPAGFAVQADDGVIVGGYVGEAPFDFALLRVTPDGRPDPTFHDGRVAIVEAGQTFAHTGSVQIARQSDGRVIWAPCRARSRSLTTADGYWPESTGTAKPTRPSVGTDG